VACADAPAAGELRSIASKRQEASRLYRAASMPAHNKLALAGGITAS
jgi:hypothetical protein